MDNCILIEEYKEKLLALTNNCQLTVGMALYIVKDLMSQLQTLYNQQLLEEKQQMLEKGTLEETFSLDVSANEENDAVSIN